MKEDINPDYNYDTELEQFYDSASRIAKDCEPDIIRAPIALQYLWTETVEKNREYHSKTGEIYEPSVPLSEDYMIDLTPSQSSPTFTDRELIAGIDSAYIRTFYAIDEVSKKVGLEEKVKESGALSRHGTMPYYYLKSHDVNLEGFLNLGLVRKNPTAYLQYLFSIGLIYYRHNEEEIFKENSEGVYQNCPKAVNYYLTQLPSIIMPLVIKSGENIDYKKLIRESNPTIAEAIRGVRNLCEGINEVKKQIPDILFSDKHPQHHEMIHTLQEILDDPEEIVRYFGLMMLGIDKDHFNECQKYYRLSQKAGQNIPAEKDVFLALANEIEQLFLDTQDFFAFDQIGDVSDLKKLNEVPSPDESIFKSIRNKAIDISQQATKTHTFIINPDKLEADPFYKPSEITLDSKPGAPPEKFDIRINYLNDLGETANLLYKIDANKDVGKAGIDSWNSLDDPKIPATSEGLSLRNALIQFSSKVLDSVLVSLPKNIPNLEVKAVLPIEKPLRPLSTSTEKPVQDSNKKIAETSKKKNSKIDFFKPKVAERKVPGERGTRPETEWSIVNVSENRKFDKFLRNRSAEDRYQILSDIEKFPQHHKGLAKLHFRINSSDTYRWRSGDYRLILVENEGPAERELILFDWDRRDKIYNRSNHR